VTRKGKKKKKHRVSQRREVEVRKKSNPATAPGKKHSDAGGSESLKNHDFDRG